MNRLRLAALVLSLACLWADALLWLSGDEGPVGWFLSAIPPPLTAFPPLLVLFFGLRKKDWWSSALVGALAIVQLLGPAGLCLARPSGDPTDLRVVSYNIAHYMYPHEQIAQTLRGLDADVICLQEASQNKGGIPERLAKSLPEHQMRYTDGLIILSKYPTSGLTTQKFPAGYVTSGWNLQQATLRIKGRDVRLINIHVIPSSVEFEKWPRVGALEAIERNFRFREEQINSVLQRAREVPGPVVICGDFNQDPFGPRYRRLADELTDSYRSTSSGFGYTTTSKIVSKRIDYVWTRGLCPLRTRVDSAKTSDHMPLIAELSFER